MVHRVLVAVAAAVVLAAGVYAVDVARDRADAQVELHKVEPEQHATYRQPPSGVTFVLALGSDERAGLSGARSDGIHIIGLNADAGQATIINIPRDTYVDIPGHGRDRINAAYQFGGPALSAATVHQLTGVPISFVLVTTFDGLVGMVNAVGGVEVNVPIPMADAASGAFFAPGPQRLDGAQALAFTRNRKIGGGDFSRTTHQGALIVHALARLRTEGTSGTDTMRYLDVFFRHVRTHGVAAADLYRLGHAALQLDPGAIRNVTMPGAGARAGDKSVVVPVTPAGELFADFRDDAVLQAH